MNLKENFNVSQILLHVIGALLFMFAFKTLFSLHETSMIELMRQGVRQGSIINTLNDNKVAPSGIINSSIWMQIGSTVGLIISFFVSLFISTRRMTSRINSIVVLIIAYAIVWLIKMPFDMVEVIVNSANPLLENIVLDLLIVGVISLGAGTYFFFSSGLSRTIRRN